MDVDPVDPANTPDNFPHDWLLRVLWILDPLGRPMTDEDLLAGGEEIRYRKPQHWRILVRPVIETAVVFVIAMAIFFEFAAWTRAALLLVAIPAIILAIDLFRRTTGRWALLALVLLVVAVAWFGPRLAAVIIAVSFGVRMFSRFVRWRYYVQIIATTRRLIMTDGLAIKRISAMVINRITDTTTTISPLGALLDYGDVRVETAGQDQAFSHIKFVRHPGLFNKTVLEILAR